MVVGTMLILLTCLSAGPARFSVRFGGGDTRRLSLTQPRKTWQTKRRLNHEASHTLSRGGGGVGRDGGDSARTGRGEGGCETLHGDVRERPGARAEGALRSR